MYSLKQPYVDIPCDSDSGKIKRFYFQLDSEGYPWPSFCDDSSASETCRKCAVKALLKLIETPIPRNYPEFIDPLTRLRQEDKE